MHHRWPRLRNRRSKRHAQNVRRRSAPRIEKLEPRHLLSASNPIPLLTLGETLFFAADDGMHGRELWKSDGTAAGTTMVADIAPGSPGSDIRSAALFDNDLFFVANDGSTGLELWKLDLATEQIALVKDIRGGTGLGSFPIDLTVYQDALFFSALDDTHGRELWKTDGTEGGTTLVSDLVPGAASGGPDNLTVFGGELYFSATGVITSGKGRQKSSSTGSELWKTDGTASGTVLVKDVAEGTSSSFPSSLTEVDGKLFFTAHGAIREGKGKKASLVRQGEELWVTDGTQAGTQLVKDIFPGSGSAAPSLLTDFGGTLYFSARDDSGPTAFWRSDGTASGTQRVLDSPVFNGTSTGGSLPVAGDRLFFETIGPTGDLELTVLDGATGTASSIQSVLPAEAVSGGAEVTLEVHNFGGTIFFTAFDASSGIELWKVDPIELAPELVLDIFPGNAIGDPAPFRLTGADQGFFFAADDGVHGRELWFSDGTSSGTSMVLDIAPSGGSSASAAHTSDSSAADSEAAAPIAQPLAHAARASKHAGPPPADGDPLIADALDELDEWVAAVDAVHELAADDAS